MKRRKHPDMHHSAKTVGGCIWTSCKRAAGNGSTAVRVTSDWDKVTCWDCLEHKPKKRFAGTDLGAPIANRSIDVVIMDDPSDHGDLAKAVARYVHQTEL